MGRVRPRQGFNATRHSWKIQALNKDLVSTTGHWESMVQGLGSTGSCRKTRNWDARQSSANCRSAVAWQQTSHFSVSSLPLSLYRSHSQTTSVLPLLLKVLIRDYGFWRGSQQKWTEGRIQVCVISTSTVPLFFLILWQLYCFQQQRDFWEKLGFCPNQLDPSLGWLGHPQLRNNINYWHCSR